jgi:tetratricopeptide (TPR) repeat protein
MDTHQGRNAIGWKLAAWALPIGAIAIALGFYIRHVSLSRDDGSPHSTSAARLERDEAAEIPDVPAGERVTFNRDIAPIVFKQCSSCHHEGEAVPFDLVSYADFKKRAKQVAQVVESRYMPPWMPAEGVVKFEGERRLSDREIALIRNWVQQGAVEGDEHDRPKPPTFTTGWRLGEPDLVAKMPEPFVVPAEGKDIYRNFVVPVDLPEGKWVKGVAMRPGGGSVVHHGFLFVDSTGETAELKDAAEEGVGYSGMDPGSGVGSPLGQFVGWQPGKQESMGSPGSAWWMPRRADIVLQMHIRPSGKVEHVQGEVGLYFGDEPAGVQPSILMLRSVDIDIPAGATDYAAESSYILPVDVEVKSVLPHAHYLGRKLSAWATLPDGERRWLLLINDWNFDWQGDYRYAEPINLPRGSQISMRYEYDNSASNARNPHNPPKHVAYGLNSSDEMGELWLQVVARSEGDRRTLETDYRRNYGFADAIAQARAVLKKEPDKPNQMVSLGVALLAGNEVDESIEQFNAALAIEPADAKARYHLGVALAMKNDLPLAVDQWKEAVRIDPNYYRAHNNLGNWYLRRQNPSKAEEHFRAAVIANENNMTARVGLARLYAAQRDWKNAEVELKHAVQIDPRNEMVRALLKDAQANTKESGE